MINTLSLCGYYYNNYPILLSSLLFMFSDISHIKLRSLTVLNGNYYAFIDLYTVFNMPESWLTKINAKLQSTSSSMFIQSCL